MNSHFIKHNQTGFPDALRCEANGLHRLREAVRGSQLQVPEVFAVDDSKLDITRIGGGRWSIKAWRALGAGLAHLHRAAQPYYGYDENNYIGLNPQPNIATDNWGEFFLQYRLRYQVSLISCQQIQDEFTAIFDTSQLRLVDYLNKHCGYPSLVHGDLWRGNVLCDGNGAVWLIDPAIYQGDREVDIAMSEMFGGFDESFYRAYRGALPLSSHYDTKKVIYNLYHYLNHYNLFGGGYLQGCRRGFEIISRL